MQFTRSEYDTMVQELLIDEEISFDMLCHIAEKTLRKSVERWCREDIDLSDKDCDDIMQDVQMRLITRTVTHFLLRGEVGQINDDPEGFEDWMFTVAKNIKRDYAGEARRRRAKFDGTDPEGLGGIVDPAADLCPPGFGKLQQASAIVLDARAGVYKTLTWLAQAIIIVSGNVTKLESNEILLGCFENKTLYEMYDAVLEKADGIRWLDISEKQKKAMTSALEKEWNDGISYGESRYRDHFMKKSGVPCGKKSISDWVNRMNDLIKRKMQNEKKDPEAGKMANGKEA